MDPRDMITSLIEAKMIEPDQLENAAQAISKDYYFLEVSGVYAALTVDDVIGLPLIRRWAEWCLRHENITEVSHEMLVDEFDEEDIDAIFEHCLCDGGIEVCLFRQVNDPHVWNPQDYDESKHTYTYNVTDDLDPSTKIFLKTRS